MKISAIVPVYNEGKSIIKEIEKLKKSLKDSKVEHEIIVVNDCSTDNTKDILSKITGIHAVDNKRNRGYGASLKKGISLAKNDWILITDCDGTYPMADIPKLIKDLSSYDMVIGSRTGKDVKVPFLRRPAKWFLRKLAEYISGEKIPDLNSGLRIFKKDMALRFWNLFPERFSFTTTITLAAMTNGYDVKFIPINYYKREGNSTIHPIKDFIGFTQLVIRIITYFKPLNVFLPVSALLIFLGAIKAGIDLYNFNRFGAGAVMVILAGIQIGFLGLLADLIIKRTKL